jgi:AraC-like DNA-binding protein
MSKGHAKIVSKSKTLYINEGDIFFIPKNLSYQSYWYGNSEIEFHSYGVEDLLSYDAKSLDLQVIKCSEELIMELAKIPAEGTSLCSKTIGDFFGIVAKLLPHMEKKNSSSAEKILSDAKKHLKSNPFLSNESLADACNVSLPYLYKIFNKYQKQAPNSCRRKVLCDKAAELLINTDLSVEEISLKLNFSSSNYFRKVFKECVGISPREYRKTLSF